MSTAEAWTIGRLLTWTAEYLKKYGSTSPRLDAEVLLAEARGCSRIELYTAFAEEPSEQVRASFKEMVRRRAEGTPVAYLVGRKEFYSLPFEINPDVLIPRPETEHLVAEAVDRAKQLTGQAPNQVAVNPTATLEQTASSSGEGQGSAGLNSTDNQLVSESSDQPWRPKPVKSFSGLRIADVGTGSGIIAVALAKSLPGAQVWALDISKPALNLAARNIAKHSVADQIKLLESDLLTAVDTGVFDLIVSNPPYISEAEYTQLPASVKNFEPKGALVAGPTGTEVIQRLLEQAAARLRPGGWLIVELSPMIAEAVIQLVDRRLWSEPIVNKDLAGHARILSVSKNK